MRVDCVKGEWQDENCFVLTQGNQALVIDPGAKVENIAPFLQDKKLVGVLLTHGHFDHALFLNELVKKFGCKVYGSPYAHDTLADHRFNQAEEWQIDANVQSLEGDGVQMLGDFEVQYFATPGHSPCGVCYKIEDILFAGDTIFNSGIGRLDLVGSDKAAMIKSLEKISQVQFSRLYSGHGESSDYARQKRNIAVFLRFLKRAS